MGSLMQRLSEWVTTWLNGRLRELATLWEQVKHAAPDQTMLSEA